MAPTNRVELEFVAEVADLRAKLDLLEQDLKNLDSTIDAGRAREIQVSIEDAVADIDRLAKKAEELEAQLDGETTIEFQAETERAIRDIKELVRTSTRELDKLRRSAKKDPFGDLAKKARDEGRALQREFTKISRRFDQTVDKLNRAARRTDVKATTQQIRRMREDVRLAAEDVARFADKIPADLREGSAGFDVVERKAREARKAIRDFNRTTAAAPNSLDVANKSAGRLSKTISGSLVPAVKGFIGLAIVDRLVRMGAAASSTAADIETLSDQFIGLLGSEEAAATKLDELRQISDDYGVSLDGLRKAYPGFIASMDDSVLSLQQQNEIFEGIAIGIAGANISTQDFAGAFQAVTQIASKGVASMEEVRQQFGERVPAAIQAMLEKMGLTFDEFNKLIQSGELMSYDVLPALAAGLTDTFGDAALRRVDSTNAAFNRTKNLLEDIAVSFGNEVNPEIVELLELFAGVEGGADNIGETLGKLAAKVVADIRTVAQAVGDIGRGDFRAAGAELVASFLDNLFILRGEAKEFAEEQADLYRDLADDLRTTGEEQVEAERSKVEQLLELQRDYVRQAKEAEQEATKARAEGNQRAADAAQKAAEKAAQQAKDAVALAVELAKEGDAERIASARQAADELVKIAQDEAGLVGNARDLKVKAAQDAAQEAIAAEVEVTAEVKKAQDERVAAARTAAQELANQAAEAARKAGRAHQREVEERVDRETEASKRLRRLSEANGRTNEQQIKRRAAIDQQAFADSSAALDKYVEAAENAYDEVEKASADGADAQARNAADAAQKAADAAKQQAARITRIIEESEQEQLKAARENAEEKRKIAEQLAQDVGASESKKARDAQEAADKAARAAEDLAKKIERSEDKRVKAAKKASDKAAEFAEKSYKRIEAAAEKAAERQRQLFEEQTDLAKELAAELAEALGQAPEIEQPGDVTQQVTQRVTVRQDGGGNLGNLRRQLQDLEKARRDLQGQPVLNLEDLDAIDAMATGIENLKEQIRELERTTADVEIAEPLDRQAAAVESVLNKLLGSDGFAAAFGEMETAIQGEVTDIVRHLQIMANSGETHSAEIEQYFNDLFEALSRGGGDFSQFADAWRAASGQIGDDARTAADKLADMAAASRQAGNEASAAGEKAGAASSGFIEFGDQVEQVGKQAEKAGGTITDAKGNVIELGDAAEQAAEQQKKAAESADSLAGSNEDAARAAEEAEDALSHFDETAQGVSLEELKTGLAGVGEELGTTTEKAGQAGEQVGQAADEVERLGAAEVGGQAAEDISQLGESSSQAAEGLDKAAAATDTAATGVQTLAGHVETLQSNLASVLERLESLATQSGEDGPLAQLAGSGEQLQTLNEPLQQTAGNLGDASQHLSAIATAIEPVNAGLEQMLTLLSDEEQSTGLTERVAQIGELREQLSGAAEDLQTISTAIESLISNAEPVDEATKTIREALDRLVERELVDKVEELSRLLTDVRDRIQETADGSQAAADAAQEWTGNLEALVESIDGLGDSLGETFQGAIDRASEALDKLATAAEQVTTKIDSLGTDGKEAIEGLIEAMKELRSQVKGLDGELRDVSATMDRIIEKGPALAEAVQGSD